MAVAPRKRKVDDVDMGYAEAAECDLPLGAEASTLQFGMLYHNHMSRDCHK